jgi:hypothetical protein
LSATTERPTISRRWYVGITMLKRTRPSVRRAAVDNRGQRVPDGKPAGSLYETGEDGGEGICLNISAAPACGARRGAAVEIDETATLTRWLLQPAKGPAPKELAGVLMLLLGVGAAAYGLYVTRGGFYSDDWSNAANYRFADPPRFWSSVSDLEGVLGGRPILALLLPIPHAIFGTDKGLQLALALVLGVLTSGCFYALLRTLSMAPLHATAIAILVLLFPWSDSIRLWATASVNSVAVCLFLVGLIVALRGLERPGRGGVAMHVVADILFLLSVLTYEVAAAAALLAGLLYIGRAPPVTVARRWAADVVVVIAALTYSLSTTVATRHVGTIGDRVGDLGTFLRESLLLLVSSLLPAASLGRLVQAGVLVLVAAIICFAVLRRRRDGGQELGEWLRWILIATVAIGAAYFMFLGSHLHPRDPGIDTRINVFAGLGFCLLAYAIVATASHLLLGAGSRAAALTIVAAAAIAIGYGIRVGDDERAWELASTRQQEVLKVVGDELAPLPHGGTVIAFGFASQAAPEVPIFNKSWDLRGALQLDFNDPALRAYPVYEGVKLRCAPGRLIVDGGGDYGRYGARYVSLFFLDVPMSSSEEIKTSSACEAALRRYRPGPVDLSGG